MTDLSHKKNVRGGHRASATRMVKKAEELLAQEDTNHSQLARIRLSLQEKLSTLKELDSEVVDLVKEEVPNEIEQADAYMEDIYDTIAKLEQLFTKTSMTAPAASTSGPLPSRNPTSESKVKLPKLTIQPFRGELTTWTTFWDSFEVAIHNNRSLSNIEKFNYLRSRPPLHAIVGLMLTDANYNEAIQVLTSRFGNKQLIIDRYMEVLLSVEAVVSDSH